MDGTPEIVVRDLHKSYPARGSAAGNGDAQMRAVLTDISFTVNRGEIIGIVGQSGSGKTVLLDQITGLQRPTSGSIQVTNHNRPERPLVELVGIDPDVLDEIRLHWAVVFQHNALFTGTVYDNIALWLREHTELDEGTISARVRNSLQAVMLDVDDVVNKERDALSGGMAKRVAVARAIAVDPKVIFYDEPTTGLDPVVAGHIHELIWDIHHRPVGADSAGDALRDRSANGVPDHEKPRAGGMGPFAQGIDNSPRTTIFITHDRDLLRRISPRVVMLDEGKVVFDGQYEQFKESEVEAARKYLEIMPALHARSAD